MGGDSPPKVGYICRIQPAVVGKRLVVRSSSEGEVGNATEPNNCSVADGANWERKHSGNGQGIYCGGFSRKPANQMELGRRILSDQYINLLHGAVHPRHGYVWTDGRAIFLAPVRLYKNRVQNEKAIKLGEFDYPGVKSVHWSCDTSQNSCFLCAVHEQNVSLWKVGGLFPKLSFKQVRKLSIQPIAQGCLWNPCRDILCILSQRTCSLFFQNTDSKGTQTLQPLESGKFQCGTWSDDGTRLIVVCMDGQLMIYTWPDIDKSLSKCDCITWKIPQVDCIVTSIICLRQDQIVCAVELPLVSMCRGDDLFNIPDGKIEPKKLSESGDNDVIRPREQGQSIKDTLMNLPRNPKVASVYDTSQLVLIQLRNGQEPVKLASLPISGVLTPDLLAYEQKMNSLVVGSNTTNILQVIAVRGNSMVKTDQLVLSKDERPKGINKADKISLPTKGVLLVVGKKNRSDMASEFTLPSGKGQDYELGLRFFEISSKDSLESYDEKSSAETSSKPKLQRAVSSTQPRPTEPAPKRPDQPPKRPVRQKSMQIPPKSNVVILSVSSDNQRVQKNDSIEKDSFSERISERASSTDSESLEIKLPVDRKSKNNFLMSPSVHNEPPLSPKTIVGAVTDFCQSTPEQTTERTVPVRLDISAIGSSNSQTGVSNIVDLSQSGESSELEIERASFSENKPSFQRQNKYFLEESIESSKMSNHENSNSKVSQSKMNASPPLLSSLGGDLDVSVDSAYNGSPSETLEKLVSLQSNHIADLKKKIDLLQRQVELTSCVFPSKYQVSEKPDTVQVVCKNAPGGPKKTFLLDDGRLQLDVLKKAFNLETIELYIDDDPCVLGANVDGYIPMRFTPHSTLEIAGNAFPSLNSSSDCSSV
ncbi:hypothetical protein ScPMuIL_012313 [Solemya velum]